MKYLHLVWAALLRRKPRTILTLLSIVVAFLLFGMLDAVRSGFANAGAEMPGANRLVTSPKLSWGTPLPISLFAEIQAVPGVIKASYGSGFEATYQNPKNEVPVEAYEPHYYDPDMYPDWYIPTRYRQAWRNTRTGALAGETLAKKYNWKVGDKIPLQSNLPKKDGSTTWTFDLVGIYRIDNPNTKLWEGILYVNWDYFDEERQTDKGTVTWYISKVADVTQLDNVAHAIDAISANSDHETKTQSEQALMAELTGQVANIGLIAGAVMGAVFFTLMLLSGNAMAQAVRERIPEIATLKTIGFRSYGVLGLILSESVLLLLIGGVLGLVLSTAVIEGVRAKMGPTLPISSVGTDIWLRGLMVAILIGLLVGVGPALRGLRLRIVDALSGR